MAQQDNLTSLTVFEDHNIRQVWHDDEWYFSVVDVVAALTDSNDPRQYWSCMKARIRSEDFIVAVSKCIQLKLIALDNKYYFTDCSSLINFVPIVRAVPAVTRPNRNEGNPNRAGIYAITNIITEESYIESSSNLNTRFSQHLALLRQENIMLPNYRQHGTYTVNLHSVWTS